MKLNRKFSPCSVLRSEVERNSVLESLQILKVKRSFDYQSDLLPLGEFKEPGHSHGCAKLGGNTGQCPLERSCA